MGKFFKILSSVVGWLLLASLLAASIFVLLALYVSCHQLASRLGIFYEAGLFLFFCVLGALVIIQMCRGYGACRTFLGLFSLAVIIGLFYAEEDLRGWSEWRSFKKQAETKGENMDFAAVIPPAVPDDQNFALSPVVASSYESRLDKQGHRIIPADTNVEDRLAMKMYRGYEWENNNFPTNGYWPLGTLTDLKAWQIYFRTPVTNADSSLTNDFPVSFSPRSPAADVLFALSKFDSAVEELRQASHLPLSRFPLNYDGEQPFNTLMPHLFSTKSCVRTLELRSLAHLELGQSGQALDEINLCLRLIDSTRTEPLLITHLVRSAELQFTIQPVYEGLAGHQWSDGDLTELERELAKLDFLADFQQTMQGERCFAIACVDHLRRHRTYDDFQTMTFTPDSDDNGIKWDVVFDAALYDLVPSGWFYQNETRIGKFYERWIVPSTDPAKHLLLPQYAIEEDNYLDSIRRRPWNFFMLMFLPALTTAETKFGYAQNEVDMARVGCALERFHLAHGEYPASLTMLAPQYIEALPDDVVGGEPLHYHRTDDGRFVLYSVGWNQTDDGGQIAHLPSGRPDNKNGDWVWQYPAK
ncbi:MAG TPA: hypothetical protein VK742_15150 [Candidatus Sulfotelmatobacter sp.]|jgi:hypothetical protein|nr:hypothetical protein [Candidatus Sulfotelmatobacter sp.]